jgi:His-Xaa-Ser system protein HxsD
MMQDTSQRIVWIKHVSDKSLTLEVDTAIYSLEALFRVCYAYTERCYLFLEPATREPVVTVRITAKKSDCDLNIIACEFSNSLIDERVRRDIAAETMSIRELIVAQAFAEADIIDRSWSEGSYIDDPKGIAI